MARRASRRRRESPCWSPCGGCRGRRDSLVLDAVHRRALRDRSCRLPGRRSDDCRGHGQPCSGNRRKEGDAVASTCSSGQRRGDNRFAKLRRRLRHASVDPASGAQGDHVFGRIEEEDRQYFSWYIVDTANLRKFDRDDEFNCQDGEDNVTAAALEWTVPRDAAWYLVIDVSMKQYVRRVTVNLRKRSKLRE